ncbi:hypothetical protein MPH_12675 [Macrophomina phaseolina MS6]|uniref:Uncharacterized protein n=2 Tax=Macrophomina phaseolina TaxID=35725 RepID=K2S0H9_MACPH|nr:hypothetical protein MPH_12675 [Macrophomina phaseolina MS6]
MPASGLYAGVPQDELARGPQPPELPKKHHVPASVKTVSLAGFCVLTISIFALLQWSAAPSNQHNAQKVQRRDGAPMLMHYPRQNVVTTTPDLGAVATTTPDMAVPSTTVPPAATTNPDAFIPIDNTPTVDDSMTSATNPDAYVPLDPVTTTPIVVGTTAPDAFIPIDNPPTDDGSVTMTTNPGAYVPVENGATTKPPTTASTSPEAFVPLDGADLGSSTTAPGAYIPAGSSASRITITEPTAATFIFTTTGADVPGGTLVITAAGSYKPGEPLLITATGSNIPGGSLVVTRTGPLVVGATAVSDRSGNSFNFSNIPDDSFATYNGGFTLSDYFVGAYMPTLLAVIYGIIWSTIFAGIAEITPFFQLTRPGGASVKESLCLEYQNAGLWHLLSTSISHKDGLVFAGTLVTLIITATIALASQVFYIGISGTCRETGKGVDCIRYLAINRRLAWAECGLLAVILVIVVMIIFGRRRRTTGVYAEVTSIAGIAVLMQNPTVVARMREAVHNHRNKVSGTRTTKFGIGQSYDRAAGWTYGFTIVAESEYAETKDENTRLFDEDADRSGSVLPWLLRPVAIIGFQIILVVLLGLILYYWFNGKASPFEDFMNSQTFGPKLMMSCFGIVIRFWWAEISNAVQTLEPYRRLTAGHATASDTILASTSLHAVSALVTSLRRHNIFGAWIALLAVLAEVLIISLSAIPFNLATLLDAFRASVIASVAIIVLMAGTLPFVLRRYKNSIVAPPTSVADTVVVLAEPGNGVVGVVAGLAGVGRRERDSVVVGAGRRYRLVEARRGRLSVEVEADAFVW